MLSPCATGCQKAGPNKYPVSGSVTLNGKPLPQGFVSFDPADGQGGAYAGEVRDGKFSLESEVGKKRVSMRASRPSQKPGPDGGPDFEQYLPARYNTATKLTANVKPENTNEITFSLTLEH